jgi:SAM-dependent methyltransferase
MSKIPRATYVPDREDYLKRLCTGRSILHLGFADAIHYQAALEEGRHLHAVLKEVTSPDRIYGVDIDEDKVRHFRELWKDDNLLVGSVEKLQDLPLNQTFDFIVVGELIEHLNNPGLMLEGVRRFMRPDSRLVITTPNALGLKYQLHALAGNDRSHGDHCVMFSFSTMNTLLIRHQLEPRSWLTAIETFGSKKNQLTRPVLDRFFRMMPHLPETLIVEAGLTSK